jgi:transcription termination factor NusB
MDYNFFLFTELLRLFDKPLFEKEYDILFGDVQVIFAEYNKSSFAMQDKSEYECMHDFLTERYKNTNQEEKDVAIATAYFQTILEKYNSFFNCIDEAYDLAKRFVKEHSHIVVWGVEVNQEYEETLYQWFLSNKKEKY